LPSPYTTPSNSAGGGRIGLTPEARDALMDVELLGTCRLITDHHFPGFNIPKDSPLRFSKTQSGEQIVAAARKNPSLLQSELQRFKDAAQASDRRGSFFFDTTALIDRYMDSLEALKRL
jgi:hypothetical protein